MEWVHAYWCICFHSNNILSGLAYWSRWSACLPVCVPACQSVHLSARPPTRPAARPSVRWSVCLLVCLYGLYVCLPVWTVCLSAHTLCVWQHACLSSRMSLSACLLVCLYGLYVWLWLWHKCFSLSAAINNELRCLIFKLIEIFSKSSRGSNNYIFKIIFTKISTRAYQVVITVFYH